VRIVVSVIAALAVAGAVGPGPIAAEDATPAATQPASAGSTQSNPVYRRMVAVNAGLHSYKADIHADIALKTFPFLSPSLDGNVYFKQPDKQAVNFDTVPALAAQFKKLYPRVEPPGAWPAIYTISVLGDDNGQTTFRLVPRKHGRVAHLDVKADDTTATIRSMTWTYEDGGYVTFDQTVFTKSGNYLIKSQTGHVELSSYKADVTIAYSNYKLNVAIADAIFTPDKQ
jgi:outer membrane lipoprotein-sorting protein